MSPYSSSYYRRAPPPLPDPETLSFPGNVIRLCTDCGLRTGCTAPVPGENVRSCEVLLVGQNPGGAEDLWGKPFVGPAGQYLDSLLFGIGVSRESVAIINMVKCLSPNNRAPTPAEFQACSRWLDLELNIIKPRIIVAMGVPATVRFLGNTGETMEHMHGRPIEKDGRIILPAYHPAAALHNPTLLRQCQEDFQVLRGLVKGASWQDYHAVDEFPDPDYKVADSPFLMRQMRDEINDIGEVAVDTETCRGKPWSVQLSARPGTAWFVPLGDNFQGKFDLTQYDATIIVHFYFADVPHLLIRDNQFWDTMTLSYLLGQAQGLKELASRLCGIRMITYKEMVHPAQQKLALEYLIKAGMEKWPDPPPIEETKWNNKKGELITRNRKPWHISRKIKNIFDDLDEKPDTDVWDRWQSIPDEERIVVESVKGPMPQASLMDIPLDQAVSYSCRDAQATLRVYHKLKVLLSNMGLDFVSAMDTRILPMVQSMMDNGMAVDVEHYRKLSEDYDIRMRVKAAELAGTVGHAFNPASSQQVATVVYGELGFKPTAFTPTKEISTDDAELKKTKHPVAKGIIQYRGLLKLKSTYADNIVRSAILDENDVPRMHTELKTTRVETGRLSSSKTQDGKGANLQQIPTRNKEAKAIRNGFIAPNGKVILEGDLAQIEMCTLAHLSNCKRLIELFLRGGDPHTEMAAKIFNVPLDEAAKSKYRYPVKRLNFGIAYLIGAHGLANQIQEYIADLEMEGEPVEIEPWDEPTCETFIEEWYQLNPEVKDFQFEMAAMARRYGYVQDMFGRIRYIPEISCPIRSIQEGGARQAANFPVTACLPADTRVTTRDGWLPIGNFVDGTKVWTGEHWATAARLSMGVHPRVRLYLSDGRTFDCDINHKLLVQDGVWPEWKNVMEIGPNVPLSQDWFTGWGQPVGSTEDWYWSGRFIGDGWLSSPTAKIRFWGMSFGSKEVQDGDRLMSWLSTKKINGATNSKTGYYPDYDKRGNFKIGGGTKAGYALWQSLGMLQRKAKEKRIPEIVFTLDYDRRLSFLMGYSDADGTARRSKGRNRHTWCISSASRGLLEDTVRLSQSVGYSSWISEPKTRVRTFKGRPISQDSTSTLWYCTILLKRRDVTILRAEILPPEPMYTLSVNDERHSFASEGLISKNSATGIIKIAMWRLWEQLPKTEWFSLVKWTMQIHDSLILEMVNDEKVYVPFVRWMLGVVQNGVKLRVPVKMDFKVGTRWGELQKVKLN